MAVIAFNPAPVPVIVEKIYPSDKIKVFAPVISGLSANWLSPPAQGEINGYGYSHSG
jgi:hypothetical protein